MRILGHRFYIMTNYQEDSFFLLVYSLETSFWVTFFISLIIGCCFWVVDGIL